MDKEILSGQVRRQYERYPYPDLDPEYDRPQMLVSGHLELMCEILWAGRKSTDRLRVLDAGCGTGGPLVAMAMAYPEAHIVGVDFSEQSLKKARRLAEKYNVRNVTFYHKSILQLPELGHQFDFVVSSGVLHHLPEPAAGLEAIGRVLDPQGAVSIMLYGKYGRTGIYMLQQALKIIEESESKKKNESPENSLDDRRIRFAHRLAQQVPSWHPMAERAKGREMQEGKDSGIVDLLLHANDIPFDVPAVYKMCEDAGMQFYRWLFPLIYNPDSFFDDPYLKIRGKKSGMNPQQQEETAELAHGRNSKHSFFAVGPEFKPPDNSITNGTWRKRRAKLTACMAWKRTQQVRLPGKTEDAYAVPFTVVQDAWGPLLLDRWELMFLSHINPGITLEDAINQPPVRREIPFRTEIEIDRAVEELLKRALDRTALVFLD